MQYKLRKSKIYKNLFEVIVPDDYERALLFLRVQEYIESPNPRFRGKAFDVEEFTEWYAKEHGDGVFTYPIDWVGFNVPLLESMECYAGLPLELYTNYDEVFVGILDKILDELPVASIVDSYIIGYDREDSVTMHHEYQHAAYFLDRAYKRKADQLMRRIPAHLKIRLTQNLKDMGYTSSAIPNELQSYLRGRDWNMPEFKKGTKRSSLEKWHRLFNKELRISSAAAGIKRD